MSAMIESVMRRVPGSISYVYNVRDRLGELKISYLHSLQESQLVGEESLKCIDLVCTASHVTFDTCLNWGMVFRTLGRL